MRLATVPNHREPAYDLDWLIERELERRDSDSSLRTGRLTRRQGEVLALYSRGLTVPMIADAMGLSVWTVVTHAKHARYALGAKNTTHATAEAIRRGLIA